MSLKKSKSIIILTVFLIAAVLLNPETVSSVTIAKLSVDPEIVHSMLGESFAVNITIAGAEYLYAWQTNMSFNSDVLDFVNVTEGDFLARQPEGHSVH